MQKLFNSFGRACQILALVLLLGACAAIQLSPREQYYSLLDTYNQRLAGALAVRPALSELSAAASVNEQAAEIGRLGEINKIAVRATELARAEEPNYQGAVALLSLALSELNNDYR